MLAALGLWNTFWLVTVTEPVDWPADRSSSSLLSSRMMIHCVGLPERRVKVLSPSNKCLNTRTPQNLESREALKHSSNTGRQKIEAMYPAKNCVASSLAGTIGSRKSNLLIGWTLASSLLATSHVRASCLQAFRLTSRPKKKGHHEVEYVALGQSRA